MSGGRPPHQPHSLSCGNAWTGSIVHPASAGKEAGGGAPGRMSSTRRWSWACWFHSQKMGGMQGTIFCRQPFGQKGSSQQMQLRNSEDYPGGCCLLWGLRAETGAGKGLVRVFLPPGFCGSHCGSCRERWGQGQAPAQASGLGGLCAQARAYTRALGQDGKLGMTTATLALAGLLSGP